MGLGRWAGLGLAGLVWAGAAQAQVEVASRAGFFQQQERGTGRADVALDAQGGLHMGFVHWEPSDQGAEAVYGYCGGGAEACAAGGSGWSYVELLPSAERVQVAATPDGRPRLLIESSAANGGTDRTYAECDEGCTDRANWRLGLLVTTQENPLDMAFGFDAPERTFAVDAAGRPHYVYSDSNYQVEPDHYGTFWTSCKADCSDPAHWVTTDLARHKEYDTESFDAPALAVDAEGRPRIVARIFGWNEDGSDAKPGLYYLACDGGCSDVANWARTWVVETGSGSYPSPTWSLALDAQGRPRVALFEGDGTENEALAHALVYMWCDAGAECGASDQPWSGSIIASGGIGEGASLALDAEGHPRIAFLNGSAEIGYAWCDAGCETAEGGTWGGALVQSQAELAAERPTALPFTCDGELWNALPPELVLASDGRPVVAHDVGVQARCLYHEWGAPEAEITYDFHEIWRGARLVTFQP